MCVHPDTLQVPFPGTDTEKKKWSDLQMHMNT